MRDIQTQEGVCVSGSGFSVLYFKSVLPITCHLIGELNGQRNGRLIDIPVKQSPFLPEISASTPISI